MISQSKCALLKIIACVTLVIICLEVPQMVYQIHYFLNNRIMKKVMSGIYSYRLSYFDLCLSGVWRKPKELSQINLMRVLPQPSQCECFNAFAECNTSTNQLILAK